MAQGVELATGYVSLTVSARGVAQEIQRELGQPIDRASKEAGQSIEEGIGGGASRGAQAAKVALSAIGSAAVLSAINRAKDAASGLQQAVGGTSAVFGEASEAVDAFAENAAESVGLSQRAARELTSQLGASLKGYGFAVDEAADKSIELTQIGADLAATFGGTTADAVAALSSALRGEFDPLERYGVALRQSAIDAEAVRLGLVTAGEEVDNMARAQAALSLITEQSADAQGQFARESDSASGQAQIASAKMEDSAANLGEALLPIYAKISETIGAVAEVFAALPEPVQTGIIALAGVVAVAGPLTNVIGLYRSFATTATTSLATAGAAQAAYTAQATNSAAAVSTLYASQSAAPGLLARLGPAFGAAGVAAAGAAVAIGLWNRAMDQAQERASEFASGVRDELAGKQTFAEFTAGLEAARQGIEDLGNQADSSTAPWDADYRAELRMGAEELTNVTEGYEALIPVIEALASETGSADQATQTILGNIDAVTAALDEGYTPAQAAAAAVNAERAAAETASATETEAFGGVIKTAEQRMSDYRDAISGATSALGDLLGISDSLVVLQDNFAQILRGVSDETTRLDEEQASGEERRSAFLEFLQEGTTAAQAIGEELLEQGRSTEEVRLRTQDYVAQLFNMRDEYGLTTTEANELRTELGLMPEQIDVEIQTNAAFIAAQFAELRRQALDFGFQDLQANIPVLGPGSNFQARASGGDFGPGWLMTGEEGPELMYVSPGVSGTVVSAPDTAAVMAGSTRGGDTYNLNGIGMDEVASEISYLQRRREMVQAGGW